MDDHRINKKTVFSSFLWKVLERLNSQGINLIVQIILARLIAPEAFGDLAIIIAITNFAAIFVQSGLAIAIIQKPDLDDLDISTLLCMSLGIALILYIIIFLGSPSIAEHFGTESLKNALRLLALVLFLNAINSIQTAILSRRMQFKKIFFRSIIAVPIAGAVGITMAYAGYEIWALVIHNLLNMLITCIVMLIGTNMKISFCFSWKRAKRIYAFSIKILATGIINGLYDTVRTMAIGWHYSSADLAFYDRGYTYSLYAVQTVNASLASVLLPTFSREQDNLATLKGMCRRSIRLSAFVMFPVLAGFAAVAKPLIVLVLTYKWIECVPYLMLFCLLRLPGCFITIEKQIYYALGRSGIILIYEIVITSVNLFLLVINLKRGPMAIAFGATAVEYIGFVIIGFISLSMIGYSWTERLADIVRPMINSAFMFGLVWCVQFIGLKPITTLIIQLPLGIIVYMIMAWVTKDENLQYTVDIIQFYFRKVSQGT